MGETIAWGDGVMLIDSVTRLGPEAAGKVLIAASHGGVYAANLAARADLRAVILNDAGIGKDEAGVAGLAYLDKFGMAAATIGHETARIGDGRDMAARGVISRVNETAERLGCVPGMACAEAAQCLVTAALPRFHPAALAETRHVVRAEPGEPVVSALDSAALVGPQDAGQIVITGSHGGLLGGRPETALKVACLAALFNDAGIGADGAGISRLPALDRRGIAAATVAAESARIGDGKSAWETGIVSRVNACAAAAAGAVGMNVRQLVACLIRNRRAIPPPLNLEST
jgi:hypothetical protein